MSVVPRTLSDKLQFFVTHLPVWLERAEEIGSTVAQVEALAGKVEIALERFSAQQQAQNAARSATMAFNLALDEVSTLGISVIERARTLSRTEGSGVFVKALIPAPAQASPIAPPGTPTRFEAELLQVGTIILRWDCKNPRGSVGTMYNVSRRLGRTGPFEFLKTVGKRKFVDLTLPIGASSVCYKVQAIRSTVTGGTGEYAIDFGHGAEQLQLNRMSAQIRGEAA